MQAKESMLRRVLVDPRAARERIEVWPTGEPLIVGQALDWPGLMLESGRNDVASVHDVTLTHHYIGLNTGDEPVHLRSVNDTAGPRDVRLSPGSAWIIPAHDSISVHAGLLTPYIRVALDPACVAGLVGDDQMAGGSEQFRRVYGIVSPQLRHLLLTLAVEAGAQNPSGLAFVEAVTAAVGRQLLLHAGTTVPRVARERGGLSPRDRRRVLEMIDAKLDRRLTIDALAREVALSPTHFAHAFKLTLGAPPHRFLLRLRLERARRMLETPNAQLSDVALRTGFADQAHFTRHFKRQFGVTPGAVLRSRRSRDRVSEP